MDFLKEALGEELYAQVAKKLEGKDNIKLANLASGGYVAKDKFLATETKANEQEKQLQELGKQLETFKGAAGTSEELKKQIGEWQAKYDADTKALNDKLERQAFDYALENALTGAKARNTKAARALLDESKISLKDGKLDGFDEQLKSVIEANGYLFEEQVQGGTGGVPNAGEPPTANVFSFDTIPDVIPGKK